MMGQVEVFNTSVAPQHRITVSVEIEKTREPLYQLFPRGDVVRAFRPTSNTEGGSKFISGFHIVRFFRCSSAKTSLDTSVS